MSPEDKNFQYRKTFSQRNGFEPVPLPLNPGEMPLRLRQELEDILQKEYRDGCVNARIGLDAADWSEVLGKLAIRQFGMSLDQGVEALCLMRCNSLILYSPFYEVLTLLEHLVIEIGDKQPTFPKRINEAFTYYQVPYIVIHSSENGWLIVQTGTEIERESVLNCLSALQEPTFVITRGHFETAGHRLAKGEFAESVGQSLKAFESCLKKISGKSEATGGEALNEYAIQITLPSPLKALMTALWRYRNEAEDVGHSKREKASTPPPERWEAQLIYVVTAACLSFMINKQRGIN